ncbi:Hypp2831 [Branchiostoma lanceolatum]|uniref:Hypp2831 protein n=1 Tax=Branchiostoma lanceolatum TaxID=7740 RepID=A0A8J9ZXR4_BRALA|nr:Hypp2831 [Branchiostoma lanceolatum]
MEEVVMEEVHSLNPDLPSIANMVFQKIKDILPRQPRVYNFVVDFEDGRWGITKSDGCVPQLQQKRVRRLQPDYYQKAGAYEFMRKLMVLHFLSNKHIRGAFREMRGTENPLLLGLTDYMEADQQRLDGGRKDETLHWEEDKEICLDPLIHRHPVKLHYALRKLVKTARRTRAKKQVIQRFQSVADFCLKHAEEEGIGEKIREMMITPSEKRLMYEAKKSEAFLDNRSKRGTRPPPPTAAYGPPKATPASSGTRGARGREPEGTCRHGRAGTRAKPACVTIAAGGAT